MTTETREVAFMRCARSVLALLMTLGLNGIRLQYTQAELTELGLSAGAGEMKYDEILDWVLRHC